VKWGLQGREEGTRHKHYNGKGSQMQIPTMQKKPIMQIDIYLYDWHISSEEIVPPDQ